MAITSVGPWVLLVIGALLMLAAVYIAVVQRRRPFTLLIFGFVSLGVGIHGPLFMGQYADFLEVIVPMVRDEDSEAYQALFEKIGQGEFDADLKKIALGYARSNPIQDMDSLLSEAIGGGTDEAGRNALMNLQTELASRKISPLPQSAQ